MNKLAVVLGLILVVVGVLGLIGTGLVGAEGTFETNLAHDLVHLVTGVLFLWGAASGRTGGVFMVFGVIYLIVAILGFVGNDPILGFIETNNADNWLHLVLGVLFVLASRGCRCAPAPMVSTPSAAPTPGQQM